MPLQLEDYALIGDTHTAALVGYDGSIDWLCVPRFDSSACFAALLGDPGHGRWLLAPAGGYRATDRRYREDSLVVETDFTTADGAVRVIDCMPIRGDQPDVYRRVECLSGRVAMRSEVAVRPEYGKVTPWIRDTGRRSTAIAGPDTLTLDSDVEHRREHSDLVADFELAEGHHAEFRLTWSKPHDPPPRHVDVGKAITRTDKWWRDWASKCSYDGPYRDAVVRSLITLKAMTYQPSGGIVAAPTTSLPEQLGGVRNWDYRFCWIRDATFTLLALLDAGYETEASAWREWLLRALAGQPEQMQLMYGVEGERRLTEHELDWLPGYANSQPVRIGNAASEQFQLDVFGELMDALHQARVHGIPPDETAWDVQRALMDFLEGHWREPDNGIWEMRGDPRHFVHSKMMAWAAVDRAVRGVEEFKLPGPVDEWKQLRDDIHREVCDRGYDADRNTFTQYYGSRSLDASVLLMASIGFLRGSDKRLRGTIGAIADELCHDGFVSRYSTTKKSEGIDGLPPGDAAFLPCTLWLADSYLLTGRKDQGRQVFERVLGLSNDLGLLSEEYDTTQRRLVGNFPQALTHLALVNTAIDLHSGHGPSRRRSHTGRKS
ncbi:glycoside hydrolase family 15 protein [Kribbella sp. NPDC051586]|uniref:glycoside hydrolase family 15 protein n=1 Tax=Kribbella sp. NPDC051586 TaxID=3364118 RepID=UPI0037AF582D